MQIFDSGTLFPLDKIADHLHRARPVESVHGNQITDAAGLQFPEPILHPGGFELKHPHGMPFAEQVERGGIVLRNGIQIDRYAMIVVD
jgi:hypothetical protein